ncbi:hypothetical protein CAPTEDRAFT_215240 [Capitella teleta]|uniref:Uncharacterized protein n=1 Tax=Capitella teleta TaxID=283909 RepID=R7VFR2_CAPTE|nr:hypothetical protein CAPTEDRAFT_215240 [Capitella teleta]|eukprot:ELU17464.1 hypothetical protein CAPTEDRAFT_215240 [Capitella teleta]
MGLPVTHGMDYGILTILRSFDNHLFLFQDTQTKLDELLICIRHGMLVDRHAISSQPSCSASTASPDLSASKAKDDVIIPIAYDIGKYVAGAKLSDKERLEMIETDWIAPPGFEWPSTTRMDRGKERRKFLGQNHFSSQYRCFAYSQTHQGI